MTQTPARRTTNQGREASRLAWRRYRAAVMQWTNNAVGGKPLVAPARHQIRTQRLYSTWPDLAKALAALSESTDLLDPGAAPPCPECGVPVEVVRAEVDPQAFAHVHVVYPCQHRVTREQALACWHANVDVEVVDINGSTLAAAERQRARSKPDGYDIDHDLAENGDDELVWALWCLLDRACGDAVPSSEVPVMWPWSPEKWEKYADLPSLRLKVIAAALLQADIDRRLARQQNPTD